LLGFTRWGYGSIRCHRDQELIDIMYLQKHVGDSFWFLCGQRECVQGGASPYLLRFVPLYSSASSEPSRLLELLPCSALTEPFGLVLRHTV
jgi:hypothetical protein